MLNLVAPCLLGLEGIIAGELRRMEASDVAAENGRVFFTGDENMLVRANLWSRCAERILIVVGKFNAFTFDELFEGTKALPWEDWIGKNDAFPVKGSSVSSKLFSVSDCQSIIKKAVVDRLSAKYHMGWFNETGPARQIQFYIHKDMAYLMIDSTGAGLHKRGYRQVGVAAPIKETMAAALCELAFVKHYSRVFDPMCGSGTILIEAALRAQNTAPGINRTFSCEQWGSISQKVFAEERDRAKSMIRQDTEFEAFGYDINPEAVGIARENSVKAGVGELTQFAAADIKDFDPSGEKGIVICNPPYGERLMTMREAERLYTIMGEKFPQKPGWSSLVITPDEMFEQRFGRKSDKRRKLYNGMIKCQAYMYFKSISS